MNGLSKNEIYSRILESLGEGSWLLAAIKKSGEGLTKTSLEEEVNEMYKKAYGRKLINSRHVLDILVARIEGAGCVDVTEKGRAKFLQLTDLGEELIEHHKRNK